MLSSTKNASLDQGKHVIICCVVFYNRIIYRLYRKNRNLDNFFISSTRNFFFKNDPIRANFMRGIDCAHFQRFPDPESGNRSVCIEAKIENF